MVLAGIVAGSKPETAQGLKAKAAVFRRFCLRAILVVGALATSVRLLAAPAAQTNAVAPVGGPQHYLVIVETSRAMQPRAQGVFDAVKGLLDSSFQGQMRRGDMLGIWTFNQEVNTGWLPFEKWSPDTHLTSALRVGRFRQTDAYENLARLENVLPEMNRVLRGPDLVTIILLTTGENEMFGTPFDAQINAAFKQWHDQQEKAHVPLLTLLRGRDGKVTDWAVTPVPATLVMPPLPSALQIAASPAAPPAFTVTRRPKAPVTPEPPQFSAPKPELRNPPPDAAAAKTEAATAPPSPPREPSGASPEKKTELVALSPPVTTPTPTATPPQSAPPTQTKPEAATEVRAREPEPQAANQPAVSEAEVKPAPEIPPAVAKLTETPPQQVALAEKSPPPAEPAAPQPRAGQPTLASQPETQPAPQPPPAAPATTEAPPQQAAVTPTVPPPETRPVPEPPQPAAHVAETAPPPAPPPVPLPQAAPQPQPTGPQHQGGRPAAAQTAVATPQPSLLRENAGSLVLLVVALAAAGWCFRAWLRSYRRPAMPIVTLPESRRANGAGHEGDTQDSLYPRSSARTIKPGTGEESIPVEHESDK